MRTSKLPAFFALAILAIAGAAQAGDPGLDAFIAAMPDFGKVRDVSTHDIGKDGSLEALVRMSEPCEADGCEWRFIAKTGETWTIASTGFAKDAYLEKTAGDDAVLNTDGVTWAWSGSVLYPYASLLETATGVEANAEEIDFISKNSEFTLTDKFTGTLYRLDLFGDGSDDRIFLIDGLYYTVGTWGTPYLIFDSENKLLDSGVSMDMPRVFKAADGDGFHIVEVTPFSNMMKTVK